MSGFVSFLKKFGQDVLKVGETLLGGSKVVIQEIQSAVSQVGDLKSIIDIIKMAEGMWAAAGAQKAGSQKLAAVQPYVASIIGDIEVIAGTKLASIVKDEASFNAGISDLTTALVKILNACGD